jgi:hypothetical protein
MPKPIRPNAPKAVVRSNSSHDTREKEVARLARELSDERKATKVTAARRQKIQEKTGLAGQ